jgi:uncharacterized protein
MRLSVANIIKKAVVDTNILVSAFVFPDGLIREVIDMTFKKQVKLYTSGPLLEEYARVLNRKFGWNDEVIAGHIKMIRRLFIAVNPGISISAVRNDPSDNKVLECAVTAGADAIISGDRHLLIMEKYKSIRIIRPSDLLKELR